MVKIHPLIIDNNTALNQNININNRQEDDSEKTTKIELIKGKASEDLDQLRADYKADFQKRAIQQEQNLEKQKFKGYEKLRELKRAQELDLKHTRRQAEEQLQNLELAYTTRLEKLKKEADINLNDLKNQNFQELETEITKSEQTMKDLEAKRSTQIQAETDHTNETIKELKHKKEGEIENLNKSSQNQSEKLNQRLESQIQQNQRQSEALLAELKQKSKSQLDSLIKEHLIKIDSHQEQQDDPFYQLIDIPIKLRETEKSFILRVDLPHYEHNTIQCSTQGDKLLIQGNREAHSALEESDGLKKQTASYQSFSKSVPLPAAVEGNRIVKEKIGNAIIFTIPKKYSSQNQSNVQMSLPRAPLKETSYEDATH